MNRSSLVFDRALAAILSVCGVLSLVLFMQMGFVKDPPPLWASLIWCLVMTVPLAWRRVYPGSVLLLVSAAFMIGGSARVPETLISNVALFLAVYTVGACVADRRRAFALRALVIIAMFIWLIVNLFASATDPALLKVYSGAGALSPLLAFLLVQLLTNLLYFGGAYFMGDRAWAGAEQQRALAASSEELRRERERTAAQSIELERLRIARELHDVVAHHVSLMGVQAGAARFTLESDPDVARDALSGVEASARSAIEELRVLLGTLRRPEAERPDTESNSTVGLAALPALVQENRVAGLSTRLETLGEEYPVETLTGFTLYRVAQEALTNVRKHGGPTATADLRLRYLPAGLELEVGNTGSAPRAGLGTGLGQLGMRERVAALGGEIELGPKPRGGYLVRVFLPRRIGATSDNPPLSGGTEPAPGPANVGLTRPPTEGPSVS